MLESDHSGNASTVSSPYGTTASTFEINLLLDLKGFWDFGVGVKTPWKRLGLIPLLNDFGDPGAQSFVRRFEILVLDLGHSGNASPVPIPSRDDCRPLKSIFCSTEGVVGFWCRTQDTMETLLRSHPCGTRSQSLARRGECWDCGCWIQDTVGTFLRSHSLTGRLCRPLSSTIFC